MFFLKKNDIIFDMKTILKYTDIEIAEENADKFDILYRELIKNNEVFNITSITDEKEVYLKHFADSLKGVDNFLDNSSVIEIGSGGGFPSVPIMIERPDLKFTLVESTGKKCKYLEKLRDILHLNCEIINARAEELGRKKEYREKFDLSTARAVARLNTLCEYCLPLVKTGGKFIAYKGSADDEVKQAENAVEILGGKITSVKKYFLGEERMSRTIVEIEKIKNTPDLYPRGRGLERKKPL